MQVQFTIHPHIGRPRTATYPIKSPAELQERVKFYESDATGNTQRVSYKEYKHGQSK